MTLLRDLLEIPERVDPGDFVLRLTEGVGDPERTLTDYVVTTQLASAFDQALGVVGSALAANSSRAAYLHGSFGSGKSHFMAVLDLLLSGNLRARAIPELAPVVARHNRWLEDGHRYLLVPLYLIGAQSLEHGIFKGYVDRVTDLHADAPLPGVYPTEPILANADELRQKMTDDAFFEALNTGAQGQDSGWGTLAAGWEDASYRAARRAMPGDPEQRRLLDDITTSLLPAYRDLAGVSPDAYVGLGDGLAALSQHANLLGYQGLVLFLDELVLWLISHAANVPFVTAEADKLSLLVESANPNRPVPVVSFVARQRDLSELVGQHALGNEYAALRDRLDHVHGRLADVITLKDRNLRAIAERRLLRPRDAAAAEQITAAFRETERFRPEVMRTLLGSNGDPQQFRQTYPFSPAFMDTLVAVSGALQRERTALRVMLQLLVDRRDDLEVGQVVPVGDLWDVVARSDQPFEPKMREQFAAAKRLHRNVLRPLLREMYAIGDEDAAAKLPPTHGLVAADRLVKTLLLAALVPEIEAFKDLTVDRLASLNHGTIVTPLPGAQNREVHEILRKLASRTGAVRLGDDPQNPTVAIVLTGVDTAGIVDSQRHLDRIGDRRQLLRRMVEDELGIAANRELRQTHKALWRGTRQEVEVVFANVRDAVDLPDATLQAQPDEWKIVVDYPFDEPGWSPRIDLERIRSLRAAGVSANVVCWVPNFFTERTYQDLGTLVVIEYLLSGSRFEDVASHLSAMERRSAQADLQNQRVELRRQITAAIRQAYGIDAADDTMVETTLSPADNFPTLRSDLHIRPPSAATLGQAFEAVLDQAFASTYPAHPRFGREVRTGDLRKVHDEVRRLFADPHGRIVPEQGTRPLLRDIATPLRLGTQGEQGFVVDQHWLHHLIGVIERAAGEGPVTVRILRAAFDDPDPMGLPRDVQDLVLLAVCETLGYRFRRHGEPYIADIGSIPDDIELQKQPLPTVEVWEQAKQNAFSLFGIAGVGEALIPGNVDELRAKVLDAAHRYQQMTFDVVAPLEGRAAILGIDVRSAPRLCTARAAREIVGDLLAASTDDVLDVLAAASAPTTMEALARSMETVDQVRRILLDQRWQIVDEVARRPDGRGLRAELAERFAEDELAASLGSTLDEAYGRATPIVLDRQTPPDSPERVTAGPGPSSGRQPVAAPPWQPPATGEAELTLDKLDEVVDRLRAALDEAPEHRVHVWWRVVE